MPRVGSRDFKSAPAGVSGWCWSIAPKRLISSADAAVDARRDVEGVCEYGQSTVRHGFTSTEPLMLATNTSAFRRLTRSQLTHAGNGSDDAMTRESGHTVKGGQSDAGLVHATRSFDLEFGEVHRTPQGSHLPNATFERHTRSCWWYRLQ
ncbi:multidrug resistance protein CDR2 [Anopheles sinensis]|uniref:Multidrug resistance protein CDR2 n=1 Tax=Anopheles sinensis TaxID=74873 RepID=A0A084WGA9_ANOSI|nr:multidrug resistance protein CDR2 [Anopheles sinensis]